MDEIEDNFFPTLRLILWSWICSDDPQAFLDTLIEEWVMYDYNTAADGIEDLDPKSIYEVLTNLKRFHIQPKRTGLLNDLDDEDEDEEVSDLLNSPIDELLDRMEAEAEDINAHNHNFLMHFKSSFDISQHSDELLTNEIEQLNELFDRGAMAHFTSRTIRTVLSRKSIDEIRNMYFAILSKTEYLEEDEDQQTYIITQSLINYRDSLLTVGKRKDVEEITASDFKMKMGSDAQWRMINNFAVTNRWIDRPIFFNEKINWMEEGEEKTLMHFVDRITKWKRPKLGTSSDLIEHPKTNSKEWRFDFIENVFTIEAFDNSKILRTLLNEARKQASRNSPLRDGFKVELEKLITALNNIGGDFPVDDPTL